MENKIHLLTSDLINKIAAGEVVERPASIVKELLENAIDAKASEIIMELEKGGLDSIRVSDNGCGMNIEEAIIALKQHTTSKISSEADLYKINTLGFRGEALASISSICELSIHSYNGLDSPVIAIANANGVDAKPGEGRAQGTTISASKIFQYIPARRKFLKAETTEYKYILEVFQQIALINYNLGFKLIKNGKTVCNYVRTQDLHERISQIFPQINNSDLIPVYYDGPDTKLQGFIGHPITGSRNLAQQYIFINKRYIKNNLIVKAVKEGFGTTVMRDEQPSFFIALNLKPDIVDVNVHPRKLEVRFNDPGKMFSIVKNSVATALKKELQQKFKENFAAVTPSLKEEIEERPLPKASIQQSIDFSKELLNGVQNIPVNRDYRQPNQSVNLVSEKDFSRITANNNKPLVSNDVFSIGNNEYLQVFDTYIIIPKDDKVLFIDQHAAAERINFEKISKRLEASDRLDRQPLLIPERITLGHYELALIKDNLDVLKKIGFVVSDFKTNSCAITEVPNLIGANNLKSIFTEVLEDIKQINEIDSSSRWREIKDKLIATIACHSSLRAGEKLPPAMVQQLISDLFKCELPYSCPHGRPIIFELNKFQLEKNFKRKI